MYMSGPFRQVPSAMDVDSYYQSTSALEFNSYYEVVTTQSGRVRSYEFAARRVVLKREAV